MTTETMTDLTREQITELLDGATPGPWLYRPHEYDDWGVVRGGVLNEEWGGYPHLAQVRDPEKLDNDVLSQHRVSGKDPWEGNARLVAAAPDLARTVIALHAQLADAQAAQAMVVERCAEFVERQGTWMQEHNLVGNGYDLVQQGKCLRALAPIDGLALVRELRADVERLNRWRAEEGEKIKRQAKALTDLTKHCQRIEAENAGLARKIGKVQRGDGDHSQIADLEAKVINQRNELANLMARDGRLAELAADRYRLAAANAALEAKVAGLVEALRNLVGPDCMYDGRNIVITAVNHGDAIRLVAEARAALATQEAGNAQSTPPISPEEAQFNAVRHHERFGPLDEKGNPIDPRRRG